MVIIHEEGEAGHEMPDLSRPVHAVSNAVTNLVKVRIWLSFDVSLLDAIVLIRYYLLRFDEFLFVWALPNHLRFSLLPLIDLSLAS